jgi:hypothetical protein
LFVSVRGAATPPQEAAAKTVFSAQSRPAYEIISDEELMAQLKEQPLLVFRGESGRKEFVFLDR